MRFLIALAVLSAVPCWATPSTYSVSGNTLTIKGGTSPEIGGNAIYVYPSVDNGAEVWIIWDYSTAANNKPGRNCALDPDDGYIHCPRQGVTQIVVSLGQNPQNSFLIAQTIPVLPEITKIQITGSSVIGGGNDGVELYMAEFPNLRSLSLTEGAPGRFHTVIFPNF